MKEQHLRTIIFLGSFILYPWLIHWCPFAVAAHPCQRCQQQSAVVLPGDACLCSHPQSHDQLVSELWKSHQCEFTHQRNPRIRTKDKMILSFQAHNNEMKMFHSIKAAQLWHFNHILASVPEMSFYPTYCSIGHFDLLSCMECHSESFWLGQDAGIVIDPPVSLCLSLAGLIVYLGMMVGAFVWGGLADRIGRRQTLLISLSINSVFAFFSSFVQGYSSFLFCRLLSGVG